MACCAKTTASATCVEVHATSKYHIDDVAVGSELTALAASRLTGDVWVGEIVVSEHSSEPTSWRTLPASDGIAGLAWVAPEVLVTGGDQGDVSLWQIDRQLSTEDAAPITAADT